MPINSGNNVVTIAVPQSAFCDFCIETGGLQQIRDIDARSDTHASILALAIQIDGNEVLLSC